MIEPVDVDIERATRHELISLITLNDSTIHDDGTRPTGRKRPVDQGRRLESAIAPNTLDREFTATAPNQKWVADFTYIWTSEGWLYVAAVLDLYSRRIVGWSMKARMTADLVTDALIMAIWRE